MNTLHSSVSYDYRLRPETKNLVCVNNPQNLSLVTNLQLLTSDLSHDFSVLHELNADSFVKRVEKFPLSCLVQVVKQMITCVVQVMAYHA